MGSMNDVLLQMMSGGMPGGMSAANLTDRLNEISRTDSRMAPIVQQIQQRLAARNNIIEAEPQTIEAESEEPEIVETPFQAARDEKIKNLTRRMYAELQMLRTRSGMLAEALGACCQCWGEDQECDYCGGDGRIGSYLISAKVFEQVVGPALEQLRQRPPFVQKQNHTHKGEGNHALR